MLKALLGSLTTLFSLAAIGQVNMPYQGLDSTSLCSGTLYDHNGPSGNYSNSANGTFYINPPGGTLTLTFTSFSLESCCDRVRVYDGIGTSGTSLVYQGGYSLPNGGSPITVPSGQATVIFTSDGSVVSSGFAMTWSAGGSTAPVASFSMSTTNPPLNWAVNFTNTSTGSGDFAWDFGDGTTSTQTNPSHTYTTSGTYQVQLIASGCIGSPDTITQSVTVQGNPTYTVSPDSLYSTVSCGGVASGSFTLNSTASTLGYSIFSREVPAPSPYALNEGFESSLGAFSISPSAYTGFSVNRVIGNAPQGTTYMQLTGSTSTDNGAVAQFPMAQPEEVSFYINPINYTSYQGYVSLNGDPVNPGNSRMAYFYMYYNTLRVYTGTSTYYLSMTTNTWSQIEIKNIDWTAKTFDLYQDGTPIASNILFYNSGITGLRQVTAWTGSTAASLGLDQFRIGTVQAEPLTLSSNSGTLSSGNSASINASINTAGMMSGTYNYEVVVRTNATGADSVQVIPFVVDVTGAPAIALDKSCINFGSVYTTQSYQDSIRVINAGCDSLNISSIVSTNTDITTDVSSLIVPPFDTAFIYVDVAPSASGAYNDTIYLNNDATNTQVCVQGTGLASPIGRMDTTGFNLVSNGCNDSLNFGFYLYNDGTANLTWDAISGSLLSDDFDASTSPSSIWQSIGSNVIGPNCWTRSGSNSMAFTGANRNAVTNSFYTSGNDSVTFWAIPGFSGADCENPDGSEQVYVEYSLNGINYVYLGYIPSTNSSAQYFSFHIPVTGNVQIRLRQSSYTGTTIDNYIIDDFEIKGVNTRFTFNPSTGTVSTLDSVWVNVTANISDLITGVYNYPLYVETNDPNQPVIITNVNITVNGDPQINIAQSGCVDFGSWINGNTVTDSVLVYNDGCADLNLTGFLSTNSDFSASANTTTLAAGDSTMIRITFNSNTVGVYTDTITVQNNDTIQTICVTATGIGAPNFDVNPDSVYASSTNCSDSIYVPITVSNLGGLSTLQFTVDSLQSGSGPGLNLTVLKTGGDVGREYPYTMTAITTYLPNANVLESVATTASAMSADLANADVLLIPEQEYLSSTDALALRPAIQNYVSNGGQVVVLANNVNNIFGLFTYSSSTTSAPTYLNVTDPSHPVFAGTNTSAFVNTGLIQSYTITTPGVNVLGTGYNTTNHTVAEMSYGSGTVIYYGYDFFYYNTDIQLGLANAISYLKDNSHVDWAYATTNQDSAQVNDSTTFGLVMLADGLSNGRHTGTMTIRTNDPNYPVVEVPFVFDLNGQAEMELPTACTDFDSVIVGLQVHDSTLVYNSGCDTLSITSFGSTSGDFSITSPLPISIAPGDSMNVAIAFAPSAMGVVNDTLQFYATQDTAGLCVTGKGLGAPVLTTTSDSIEVVLNKCDNFTIDTYDISNTGQGAMTYDIFFGQYQEDTSYTSFTTNYATTSHTFNNTLTTADSIVVTVIYQGDFDYYNEYITLDIEGVNIGNTYGVYTPFGTPDTATFVITGANVNTFLADGTLSASVQNSSYVTYTSGYTNFHDVKVQIYNYGLPAWLTFPSTTTGTLGIGASDTKSLIFNGVSLAAGVYTTDMNILTNDPTQPHKVVPIIFDVRDEASIALSDTCVSLPTTQINDTSTTTIWVINDGCQPLNVTNITSTINVFKAAPKNFTVPAGDSVQVTISFTPTAPATYSANMTVVSAVGSETFCVNGTSTARPTADWQWGIIDPCDGQVLFSDHSQGTVTGYLWQFGDGNASQVPSPTHSYTRPGTYKVTLTVSNTSGFDTLSQYITVNPFYAGYGVEMNGQVVMDDTLYINTPITFNDSSITASQWTWYFGDGNLSNSQNPTHTYLNTGVYQVTLDAEDSTGCRKLVSRSFWLVSGISVEEEIAQSLRVYPNPSSGVFHIASDNVDWSEVTLNLTSMSGELLIHERAEANAPIQQMDIAQLPPGVYMLRITSERGWTTVRRIIRE
ncbi:MAG: PKD domain-containing protein [Flavobacteriia bacterium]|nr:PKD domain-containing protein [Flavobacteriia bacterium]